MALLGVLFLVAQCLLNIHSTIGVSCLRCFDVAHPSDCRETAICGLGEVCYTREYTNHNGIQGYHLGCQMQNLCPSVTDLSPLVGKRLLVAPALPQMCFQCCSGDDCNSKLCSGGGSSSHGIVSTARPVLHVTTVSPVHHETSARPQPIHCSDPFTRYGNKCYFISLNLESWRKARLRCEAKGADLVSVESQDEQDYLRRQLTALNANQVESFWLGGYYNHLSGKWQWNDGLALTFTCWYPGEPTLPSLDRTYYMYMLNPAYSFAYSNATWSAWKSAEFGYICEM